MAACGDTDDSVSFQAAPRDARTSRTRFGPARIMGRREKCTQA